MDEPYRASVDMLTPDGAAVNIPVESYQQALDRGYRDMSGAAVHEQDLEQRYGSSPGTALAEGIARGATFGLSDEILPGLAGVDPAAIRERKERNPIAAGVGAVGGFLGTAGLTGVAGAATKAGEITAGAVSGLAEGGLLARATAAALPVAARGSVEGAAMGLGEGVSDIALHKDPLTAEGVLGALAENTLLGAALGGGAGVAAEGLGAAIGYAGRTASRVAREAAERLSSDTGVRALDPEVRALLSSPDLASASPTGLRAMRGAEESALREAQAAGRREVAADVRAFTVDWSDSVDRIAAQVPKQAGLQAPLRNSRTMLKVVTDNEVGLARDPGVALRALETQQSRLERLAEKYPEGTFDNWLERNADLQSRIKSLAGDVASPRLAAIDEKIAQLSDPVPGTGIARRLVGMGVGAVVGGGPIGAMIGGEIANLLTKKIMGRFATTATAISDGAAGLLSRAGSLKPPMQALKDFAVAVGVKAGEDHYTAVTRALSTAASDPAGLSNTVGQQLTGLREVNAPLASQVQRKLVDRLTFLASKVPTPPPAPIFGAFRDLGVSDSDRSSFGRYVAAAFDQLRVLQELKAGQLSPETLETHEVLYPATLARIREKVAETLTQPGVVDRVPYAMREQLSALTGGATDPTLEQSFIAAMQLNLAPEEPSQSSMPDAGPIRSGADNATQAQRLAGE